MMNIVDIIVDDFYMWWIFDFVVCGEVQFCLEFVFWFGVVVFMVGFWVQFLFDVGVF